MQDTTEQDMPLNTKYSEICKLEALLSGAAIPHRITRCLDGWQIIYPDERTGRTVCSCVEHHMSYGSSQNLLEIMGLLNNNERKFDKVVGFLTADNVFGRMKDDWERRKNRGSKVERAAAQL